MPRREFTPPAVVSHDPERPHAQETATRLDYGPDLEPSPGRMSTFVFIMVVVTVFFAVWFVTTPLAPSERDKTEQTEQIVTEREATAAQQVVDADTFWNGLSATNQAWLCGQLRRFGLPDLYYQLDMPEPMEQRLVQILMDECN